MKENGHLLLVAEILDCMEVCYHSIRLKSTTRDMFDMLLEIEAMFYRARKITNTFISIVYR